MYKILENSRSVIKNRVEKNRNFMMDDAGGCHRMETKQQMKKESMKNMKKIIRQSRKASETSYDT